MRLSRHTSEIEPCLGRCATALLRVATPACGDDIRPGVLAALGPWNDVIEILGLMAAVLASVAVTLEDGPSVDRDPPLIRNPHVSSESHDRRRRHRDDLGTPERSVCNQNVGAITEHEHQGASHGDHRERFQACVQDECS